MNFDTVLLGLYIFALCCDKCANGCIVNLFCITALYNDFPQTIIDKLCLDLNGSWNKEALPHLGRHPNDYHKFVKEEMDKAADMAGNNVELFLYYFEKNVKEKVRNNPDMLYKNYWKNNK